MPALKTISTEYGTKALTDEADEKIKASMPGQKSKPKTSTPQSLVMPPLPMELQNRAAPLPVSGQVAPLPDPPPNMQPPSMPLSGMPLINQSMPPQMQPQSSVQTVQPQSSKAVSQISGLSLSMPKTLGQADYTEYSAGNFDKSLYSSSPYDVQPDTEQFMLSLMEDNKNKLIGSIPRIGQNADLKFAGSEAVKPSLWSQVGKQVGVQGLQAAGNMIGNTLSTLENTQYNDYQNDMNYWLSQGKFWFDPKSELTPDIDTYVAQMPSAVQAVGGARSFASNIAGGMATGAAAGLGAGPVGAAVGAGIGGLTGLVKSLFTYNSAKNEDAKNRSRAMQAYERDLKEWTINKNKRIIAQMEADAQNRNAAQSALTAKNEAMEAAADVKKENSARERRAVIKNAIMTAGNAGREYRQRRLNKQAA